MLHTKMHLVYKYLLLEDIYFKDSVIMNEGIFMHFNSPSNELEITVCNDRVFSGPKLLNYS